MSRRHPAGSLAAKAHPSGSLSSAAHPDGSLTSKAHPAGSLVTRVHPPKAGGAEEDGDSFAGYINEIDSLAAWWSPNAKEAGNLTDDAVAMTQLGPDTNPNLLAVVASTGNFRVVEDNIGTTESLTSAIESIQSDELNFVGIDSGTSQSTELADCLEREGGVMSGFAFFKNAGDSFDSANYGNIFQWYGDSSSTTAQADTYLGLGFWKGSGSPTKGRVRMSLANSLTFTGGSTMDQGEWYFIGWRQHATEGTTGSFIVYVVEVGEAWSTKETITGDLTDAAKDGLTLGMGQYGSPPKAWDGWRWGPIGFFTSDIDEDGLEAIFESIE